MGAHYERARLFFRQGRYAQAETELREELAEHPHWGQAHAFLGRCLAHQKRLPEALEACEEAVRLAPELPYAHYMLGQTFLDLNRLDRAEEALREALRLNPRDAEQLEQLSRVQYQRGEKYGALASVNQGLEIDPQHVGCLNRRGYYLRWLGYGKESEESLRAALKLDPESAYTHTNLAWTLWNKAHTRSGGAGPLFQPWIAARGVELREAHKHFLEALRLDPNSDWAKTGAVETLLTRRKAVARALLVVPLFLSLGLLFVDAAPRPGAAEGPDLLFFGAVLSLAGVVTVVTANGPAYVAMRWNRLGAALLSPGRRLAAAWTTACLAAAASAGVAALCTPPPTAFAVLFVGLALVRPLTTACEAAAGLVRKVMTGYAVVLAAAGLACAVRIAFGGPKEQAATAIALVLGGLFGSLGSAGIARDMEKRAPGKRA